MQYTRTSQTVLAASRACFTLLSLLTLQGLAATTYHVSLDGDDAHDGRSPTHAFRTIQRGVDALSEGDTLRIAPGEYHEAVAREGLGGPDRDTVIRAEIPGTVVLRGDVPAPAFREAPGAAQVFIADVDHPVTGVAERDTLRVLRQAMDPAELLFHPGSFHHDAENGLLYLRPSHFRAPEAHHYGLSTFGTHGFALSNPRRVTIDGVVVTGFIAEVDHGRHGLGYGVTWGLFLGNPRDCTIRNCTAYLNRGGIAFHRDGDGRGNLIKRCRAYANPGVMDAGAGIKGHSADHDEIRDCYVYRCGDIGIGFYGQGIRGPAILRHNLAWGNGTADIRIKGGGRENPLAKHSIALGNLDVYNVTNCLIGVDNIYNRDPGPDSVMGFLTGEWVPDQDFADPDNLDFRLTADSRLRGGSPDGSDRGAFAYADVFRFVAPEGNDAQDGRSPGRAFRTLARAVAARDWQPGETLYAHAGHYASPGRLRIEGAQDNPVVIAGRGTAPFVIEGPLHLENSRAVRFERVWFAGLVSVEQSQDVTFHQCAFLDTGTGLTVRETADLRVTHGQFTGFRTAAIRLDAVRSAFLSGNLFDNDRGVALLLNTREGLRYCDYNLYRSGENAWRLNGEVIGTTALPGGHERYARIGTPVFADTTSPPQLTDPAQFAGLGPAGKPVGLYHEFRPVPLHMTDPVLHAVSDTTADIEWWTSRSATCRVAWGDTPAMTHRAEVAARGYASFSLTGLEPGRRYYVQVLSAEPDSLAQAQRVQAAGASGVLAFETAAAPSPARRFFVAPDGNDANSGMQREAALRTVNRAAALAQAGDTVEIAGGVYTESVRVRATGAPDRPVTFRAARGERVVFDGGGRSLETAFHLYGKHHVHLDGFYFRGFKHVGWDGVIQVMHSDHVTITRCFSTGLGRGTSPSFVYAEHAAHLTIENCVLVTGYEGIVVRGCPHLTVRHSVFLRNLIQAVIVNNAPNQPVTLTHNIFADSTIDKGRVGYIEVARVESLTERDNLYYMRLPDDERKPFFFYGDAEYERAAEHYRVPILYPEPSRITTLTRMSLAEYQQQFAPGSGSFYGDPGFRRGLELADIAAGDYLGDRLSLMDLDFPDLFASHPEAQERNIGLQPDAFADL